MVLMVGAMFVFGTQDALSRYLAESYTVLGVMLIRYWFFAGFVVVRAAAMAVLFVAALIYMSYNTVFLYYQF